MMRALPLVVAWLILAGSLPAQWQIGQRGFNTAPAASFALVRHTSTQTSVSSVNMTGANLLLILVFNNATIVAPTDGSSNTYHPLTAQTSSAHGIFIQIFYAYTPTVTSSMTFTNNGDTAYGGILIAGFSGALASSGVLDTQSGAIGASITQLQPGSITPAVPGELFFTGIQPESAGTPAIDSSFTILNSITAGGATVSDAYLVSSSAQNPKWSGWSSAYAGSPMAAFKP